MNSEVAQSKQTAPSIEEFGGLSGLHEVITDLYDRIFKDPMISYLFKGKDPHSLIQRELEWTAKALGAAVDYQGRSMAEAHQKHPIRRGHFYRRNQLLEEAMSAHHLSESCVLWWRSHSKAMERAILGGARSDHRCEKTANQHNNSAPSLWTSS